MWICCNLATLSDKNKYVKLGFNTASVPLEVPTSGCPGLSDCPGIPDHLVTNPQQIEAKEFEPTVQVL